MRTRSRAFWAAIILLGLALAGAAPQRAARIAAAMPAPARPAQLDCTITVCSFVYLPVVSRPPVPLLNEPLGPGQIDTIAPTLAWTPTATGTDYVIEVATTPDFLPDTYAFTRTESINPPNRQIQRTVPRNNLDGSTTYYWRVGVVTPGGTNYSLVGQFTTAAEDPTRLSPNPQFLSPPDGARLTTLTPTLSWAPVDGAVIYRVRLYDPNGDDVLTSNLIEASKTSYTTRPLLPKVVYYWRLRVYNGYGWNEYGPVPGWRFRTP